MKYVLLFACALSVLPDAAMAQPYRESVDQPAFGGVKVAASIDYRWLDGDYSLPLLDSRIDQKKGGVGFRGSLGYDAQLGDMIVVGAEAGLGRGGKTLETSNLAGTYSLRPGWNWDVSARAGILPAPNVLLYGRAGYSWLRVRETTDFRATNLTDLRHDGTEKGFLWGAGVETRLASGMFARGEYNRANYGSGLTSSKIQLGVGIGF